MLNENGFKQLPGQGHAFPRLERAKAAAHYFRISEMTLWRWRQLPGFPQPLKAGRTRLYDIGAIQDWMAQGEGA